MKFWNKFVRSVAGKSPERFPTTLPRNTSTASFTHKPPTPEPRLAFAGFKKPSVEDEGIYSDPEELLRNRRKSFTNDYIKNGFRNNPEISGTFDNNNDSNYRSNIVAAGTTSTSDNQLSYWQNLFHDQQQLKQHRNEPPRSERSGREPRVKSVHQSDRGDGGRNPEAAAGSADHQHYPSPVRFASLDRNRIFLTKNPNPASTRSNGQIKVKGCEGADGQNSHFYPSSPPSAFEVPISRSRQRITKSTTPGSRVSYGFRPNGTPNSDHQLMTQSSQYSIDDADADNSQMSYINSTPNSEEHYWYSCSYSPAPAGNNRLYSANNNDDPSNYVHYSSATHQNTLSSNRNINNNNNKDNNNGYSYNNNINKNSSHNGVNNASFPNFNEFQLKQQAAQLNEPIYANPTQLVESSALLRARPNSIAESKFYSSTERHRSNKDSHSKRARSQSQELRYAEEKHRMHAQLQKSENRKRDLWWEIQTLLTDKYRLQETQKAIEQESNCLRSQINDFEREIYAMQQAVNHQFPAVAHSQNSLCRSCSQVCGKLDTSAFNDCLSFDDCVVKESNYC